MREVFYHFPFPFLSSPAVLISIRPLHILPQLHYQMDAEIRCVAGGWSAHTHHLQIQEQALPHTALVPAGEHRLGRQGILKLGERARRAPY